jgi:hypothetical protein
MSGTLIQELVCEVAELAQSRENIERQNLWTRHNNKTGDGRILSNLHLWKIADHALWHEIIPDDTILSESPEERFIERQLKQRLFKFKQIDDYDVLLPTLWVDAVVQRTRPDFGLEPKTENPDNATGAKRYLSVIADTADIRRLRAPQWTLDEKSTAEKIAGIQQLAGSRIPVKTMLPQLGTSPFEYVVRFRGMEEVLYDFYDNPELIHSMMRFFTDCIIGDYRRIEKDYGLDPESTWDFRIHYDRLENPDAPFTLQNCWAYISAQSAGIISPEMYREFIQPYHERIAELFGKVYYHGCENLTQKAGIIRRLPHLRRFHISPWSDIDAILDELGGSFVYETHVHPTSHLFLFDDKTIRKDVRGIAQKCLDRGVFADINLSDIETVHGDIGKLVRWSRIAKEAVESIC